jgi:hypothetical protein
MSDLHIDGTPRHKTHLEQANRVSRIEETDNMEYDVLNGPETMGHKGYP